MLALISGIISLRFFSFENVLLGALAAFRGPFWDSFLAIFKDMFVYLLMLARHRTRLKTDDLQGEAKQAQQEQKRTMILMIFERKGKIQILSVFEGSKTTTNQQIININL